MKEWDHCNLRVTLSMTFETGVVREEAASRAVVDKQREMLLVRVEFFMFLRALHMFDRKLALAPVLALTPGIPSHPDSFEQLIAISRHPVISQHVTHLFYKSDVLDRYESQYDWEGNLFSERVRVKPPANSGASDREYQASEQESVMGNPLPHQLPREAIDRAYAQYQRLFTLQEQLRD